jgi:tetraacyldisaccharide 4'-kinase
MKSPAFWQKPNSPLALLLTPLGWVYASATARRLARGDPWRAPVPVICVGNLTAGGTGKTPVVRDLVARLIAMGRCPGILSRGYGGKMTGPIQVDTALHTAPEVGDEPLLLARDAPCWISADRAAGARAMIDAGIDVIVMDDGLQNPELAQDLRLIVVDGAAGFGNGRPIPAGPLREPVQVGMARGDALIIVGEDQHRIYQAFSFQINALRVDTDIQDTDCLAGTLLFAFAGIGQPEKFRASLTAAGGTIAAFKPFADHHHYTQAELTALSARAEALGAQLVTTEKDWVRLNLEWRSRIKPVAIALKWQAEAAVTLLLSKLLKNG